MRECFTKTRYVNIQPDNRMNLRCFWSLSQTVFYTNQRPRHVESDMGYLLSKKRCFSNERECSVYIQMRPLLWTKTGASLFFFVCGLLKRALLKYNWIHQIFLLFAWTAWENIETPSRLIQRWLLLQWHHVSIQTLFPFQTFLFFFFVWYGAYFNICWSLVSSSKVFP